MWAKLLIAVWFRSASGSQPLPGRAKHGKDQFDARAKTTAGSMEGMSVEAQNNPMRSEYIADYWCAWSLEDRPRLPALLVDDMQVEYDSYVRGIVPNVKLLVDAFRQAGLPIFWSTWWRFGPDDGYFNTMDRFYGPIGWNSSLNALYIHKPNGGDVLAEVAPMTEQERRRVMRKSVSLDMFDERVMQWMLPGGQGTLDEELQKLGVDTVVQVGAWTEDCITSTAFHAFSLQYDVVVIQDAVSTASSAHWPAIQVMRGSIAKIHFAAEVAEYVAKGRPVIAPAMPPSRKALGGRVLPPPARQATHYAAVAATPGATGASATELRAVEAEQIAAAAVEAAAAHASGPWSLAFACAAVSGPASFVVGWVLGRRSRQTVSTVSLL